MGTIAVGDWLSVNLETKRGIASSRKFFCQVQHVFGNAEFTVSFVVTYRDEIDQFVWPNIEDVSDIKFCQVLRVVAAPKLLRRGVMIFEN